MKRVYKLAANFNSVEFEITNDDLMDVLDFENEAKYDEDGELTFDVPEEVLTKRILQREYDILSSIRVINVAPPIKQAEPVEPASEKQIKWAESLGMKDAANKSKKELWEYIQAHKNK